MSAILSDIFLYPVKSTMGFATDQASVEPRGLVGDRRWMVVDQQGRFITQREQGRMTLIHSHFDGVNVRLSAAGFGEMELSAGDERLTVTVWNDKVSARLAEAAVQQWLTTVLGQNARAVMMDDSSHRAVDPQYAKENEPVSFADGFPLLLISRASLADLNSRLTQAVDMRRFRPNLVVEGCDAFAEDGWHRIQINGLHFDLVKPCSRCVLTTRDPDSGELNSEREPLRSLSSYRRQTGGVMFGQNLIARDSGVIQRGAKIEIID